MTIAGCPILVAFNHEVVFGAEPPLHQMAAYGRYQTFASNRFSDAPSGVNTDTRSLQRPLARLKIPQFLRIPLRPGKEIDKIRRILSR
jgi:hypothetical protein